MLIISHIKSTIIKIKKILLILIIILFSKQFELHSTKSTKNITIFIHGTFMPGLAILNPFKTYNQTINSSDRYYKCLKKLRADSVLYEDSIMLEEGLKKIDSNIIYNYSQFNLVPGISKKGAYHAIGAYDLIYKNINNNIENDYYTFGFSGILSDVYRKEAGYQLYYELNNLLNNYYEKGFRPIITICAYSHGGNVALYLAEAEDTYKKKLYIDKLILYGTPIQEETATLALSDIFKKVYNLYSEADKVQSNDTFSTISGKSFKKFKDLYQNISSIKIDIIDNENFSKIVDVKLLAQDNPTAFGHFSYWYFNKYNIFPIDAKKDVQNVYNYLEPMPLAILTPIFIDIIENSQNFLDKQYIKQLNISIRINNKELEIVSLADNTDPNKIIYKSKNINNLLNKIQRYAKSNWKPYTHTSETTRIGVGIFAALQSLIT